MEVNSSFVVPIEVQNGRNIIDKKILALVLEDISETVTRDVKDLAELLLAFGSIEKIRSLNVSAMINFDSQSLEKFILTAKNISRLVIERTYSSQINLENLFVFKYTLIFPKKTIQTLKIPAKYQLGKKDASYDGKNGLKNIKKKVFFIWQDYLVLSKNSALEQNIQDARFMQQMNRAIEDAPNLNYWLPPLISEHQFEYLGKFLKEEKAVFRIHNKYEQGVAHSLYDDLINHDEEIAKIKKKVFAVLGHVDKSQAKLLVQDWFKTKS